VPSNLSAPSNGKFLGAVDHGDGWTTWNWSAANPNTYAIALNIGPYVEIADQYESRFGNRYPIQYWHLKSDDPAKARALFDEIGPMLDFYEATVGPYPFGDEKMGVVETPHLGMEHQTINAYGNEYKLDGRGFDWLLHHELSHEWFGNQLTNRNADDMWLHEGLGSYMQPLYDRWLNGERFMEASLLEQRRGLINKFPGGLRRGEVRGRGLPRRHRPRSRHLQQGLADRPQPAHADRRRGLLPFGDATGLRHGDAASGRVPAALRHDRRVPGHRQRGDRARP
jgi:hypothetical protein